MISEKDYQLDSWRMTHRRHDGATAKVQCRLQGTGMMSDQYGVLIHYPPVNGWAQFEYAHLDGRYGLHTGSLEEASRWIQDPANGFEAWQRDLSEKHLSLVGKKIVIQERYNYLSGRHEGICVSVERTDDGPSYTVDTGETSLYVVHHDDGSKTTKQSPVHYTGTLVVEAAAAHGDEEFEISEVTARSFRDEWDMLSEYAGSAT